MSFSRKKSPSQGSNGFSNNSQQRGKPRFSHGSGGSGGQGHNNNRPRKNYGAMREKYLTQARDALASGDRVLAENYFQHADHCFRMIAEENASRPQRAPVVQERQAVETPVEATADAVTDSATDSDDGISMNVSSLPAFLTANYEPPKKDAEAETPQNWEE